MLNLITGKQRSGKSYFCVTLIVDYLRNSSRHLYTNLPINPDIVADVACGGRLRYPAVYSAYLSRLHLFISFAGRSRQNFKSFKSLNPDFVKLYHSSFSKDDLKNNLIIPLGEGNFIIRQFWRYTRANSVIFFDEVYEIFGSLDQLSKGRDLRKELLSYSKQHGHFKDDLYLITHDPADIDKIIRKSINKEYIVRNSKYQNILENRLFKGLRWPVQFFMISGFEYGSREAQDIFNVFPKKEIFACYNSFNVSDLLEKDCAGLADTSSDTAIDHRQNFKGFFKQAAPLFFLIFVIVIFFYVLISEGIDYLSSNSKNNVIEEKKSIKNSGSSDEITSIPDIIFISPSKMVFSNNVILEKGSVINGKVCEIIAPVCAHFSDLDGTYSCHIQDLRSWAALGRIDSKKFHQTKRTVSRSKKTESGEKTTASPKTRSSFK